jgi:molecular chaperone DnaK
MSTTIDYGIYLGEEYSCIAVLNGKDIEVIENNENQKLTPCAVWISEKKRLYTGLYAKNRLFEDPENAYSKWKPSMGKTDIVYTFTRSGRAMSPEDLSAEILKSLKADVKQRKGDE